MVFSYKNALWKLTVLLILGSPVVLTVLRLGELDYLHLPLSPFPSLYKSSCASVFCCCCYFAYDL